MSEQGEMTPYQQAHAVLNMKRGDIEKAFNVWLEAYAARKVEEELERYKRDELARLCNWRGITEGEECPECGGSGTKAYGSTATWHGGIGGQAITSGVCDRCWGSGSISWQGANLKNIKQQFAAKDAEIARLKAQVEMLREALDNYDLAVVEAHEILQNPIEDDREIDRIKWINEHSAMILDGPLASTAEEGKA